MVDELAGGVQALAAVTQQTRGVGLRVEVEEKRAINHPQTAMKDVETALKLHCMKTIECVDGQQKEKDVHIPGNGTVFLSW